MGYQEAISVLNGNSFVVSDLHGDVHPDSRVPPHGFFSQDTRFISLWRLSIQGQPTDILSTAQLDYFVGEFFLINRSPDFFAAPELGIVRQRLVADAWLEDVVVVNHRNEDVHVALDIEVGTDFADLFEVKDNAIRERDITTDRGDRELVMRYRNGGVLRETRITVNEPAAIEENALRLDLWLASRESGASRS
jgi:N-terminal domain of (some) glycogen debranching enzymes